jgi:hypothetical protein
VSLGMLQNVVTHPIRSVSSPERGGRYSKPLHVARKIYVRINNSNPILVADSPERETVEAAGWEVGTDGLGVVL